MRARMLSRYLDTDGDGTGTKNAIGDYSGAAEEFFIEVPASKHYSIARLIVRIEDVGNFDAGKYGNNITLTNGIEVEVRDNDDVVLIDLTDGVAIKTNAQWAGLCHDLTIHAFGTGNDTATIRWTFARSGDPIALEAGHKLVVKLNDAFDNLVQHYFLLQGQEYD